MKSILLSTAAAIMLFASQASATCIADCTTQTNSQTANPSQTNTQSNTQANTQVNSQNTSQGQSQHQGQVQGVDVDQQQIGIQGNEQGVSIYEEDKRETHSAYAPALSAGSDTCLGSTSAGAQGGLFGVSFGTNWTDQNCENIRSAKALYDMGEKQAALLIMCLANGGRNVAALEASGHDCSPVTDSGGETEVSYIPPNHAGPVQTASMEETVTITRVIREAK